MNLSAKADLMYGGLTGEEAERALTVLRERGWHLVSNATIDVEERAGYWEQLRTVTIQVDEEVITTTKSISQQVLAEVRQPEAVMAVTDNHLRAVALEHVGELIGLRDRGVA